MWWRVLHLHFVADGAVLPNTTCLIRCGIQDHKEEADICPLQDRAITSLALDREALRVEEGPIVLCPLVARHPVDDGPRVHHAHLVQPPTPPQVHAVDLDDGHRVGVDAGKPCVLSGARGGEAQNSMSSPRGRRPRVARILHRNLHPLVSPRTRANFGRIPAIELQVSTQ